MYLTLSIYLTYLSTLSHLPFLSYQSYQSIYLKREDLLHGGAHKINNTLGQALLAKKIEEDKWVFIEGCKHPKSVTLLLRGGSQRVFRWRKIRRN